MTDVHVLSLGAGVQSTTVLLLALEGRIHPFDAAVFADTQDEPRAVYSHLWWLAGLPGQVPIHVQSVGRLGDDLIRGQNTTNQRFAAIPAFTKADFAAAEVGRTRRQCTKEYKTEVIERTVRRQVLGLRPRQRVAKHTTVHRYVGISYDEQRRAVSVKERIESNPRMVAHFPLLDLGWTRKDCLTYLADKVPHIVPRSACVFCPFKSDREWQKLKDEQPEDWARAVEVDAALRVPGAAAARNMDRPLYVHRSCKPLDQVEFQNGTGWLGFMLECEGMCGV